MLWQGKLLLFHQYLKYQQVLLISDKTNPVLDRIPTDEDIDRLAPVVGADSLHFLVELGLEFQDWDQIEYRCGRDLVHTNRTILNVWKEKCENGPGVRPTMRTIYKAFANIGKSQRVVERCFKKEKYQIDISNLFL